MLLREDPKRGVSEVLVFIKLKRFLKKTQRIAVMHWNLSQPSEFLILHSHVNGADLGGIYEFLVYLRSRLECEIVSYDYCGYGASSGSTTENNLRRAGEAVLEYVTRKLNRPLNKIILYGQSIGSVPTAHLASKHDVAGVIFHSGLYSGLRLVLQSKRSKAMSSCVDPFRNVDLIEKIRAPVLFIHGIEDPVIPVSHAVELYQMCPNAVEPLWLEEGGHIGLELRPAFYKRLQEFLEFIKNKQNPLGRSDSLKKSSSNPLSVKKSTSV